MVTVHPFQTHGLSPLFNNGSFSHSNPPRYTSIKTTDYWSSSLNGTANIMLYSCRRQEHTFSITFKLNSYHCTQKHCAGKSWKSESIIWSDKFAYRTGTVNSNTVNSKFHLIRSYCEIFSYHFPAISCLKCTVNSNFYLIRSKTLLTNDFELTVPNLYWYRNKVANLASESFLKCMETLLPDVITIAISEANVRKQEFAKSGFKRLPSPEVHKIPRKFLLIYQFKPATFCNSFK